MIGKLITTIIDADEGIQSLINERLYPVSSDPTDETENPQSNNFPSIYYIATALPKTLKNGPINVNWELIILTMSKDYGESWDLSFLIAEAFEAANRKTINEFKVNDVEVKSIADDFEFNILTFGQTIKINLRTQRIEV